MDKVSFLDAFGKLDLKSDLVEQFENSLVERMVYSEKNSFLRVYLYNDELISKSYIISLEKELGRKVFSHKQIQVKIHEKYKLSDQYTPQNWFDIYEESINLELKQYDQVLQTLFRQGSPAFNDEGVLVVKIPDTPIGHSKGTELKEVLERIAGERCGVSLNVEIEFTEPVESRRRKENEIRVQHMIKEITLRNAGPDDAINIRDLVNQEDGSQGELSGTAVPAPEGLPWDDNAVAPAPSKEAENAAPEVKPADSKPKEASKDSAASKYGAKTLKSFSEGGEKKFKSGKKGGFEFSRTLRKSDNPNLIYNKEFEGEAVKLEDVQDELGEIIVEGQIINIEEKFLEKSGKTIYKFEISDFTDSIKIKMFLSQEFTDEIRPLAKVGDFIKAKGVVAFDSFDRELEMGSVFGIMKGSYSAKKREDLWPRKRVELHCHTKMSDMDGIADAGAVIKQAKNFGHTAVAITDHGALQSFPEANHAIKPDDPFKIIYGLEGYLVNDLKTPVTNSKGQDFDNHYVVFDIETTGFSPVSDKIIEIGAVKIQNGKVTDSFSEFINPEIPIPRKIVKLTDINDSMVMDAPTVDVILPRFVQFCEDCIMVAHNADFDMSFINAKCKEQGIDVDYTYIDTMRISQALFPTQARHNLDALCKTLNLVNEKHHRAVADAEVTGKIFMRFQEMLADKDIHNLDELNEYCKLPKEAIARLHEYHITILAKNEIGRRNLYKLVSMSNLDYYHRYPKIPKSKIMEYREGLILGTACSNGELYSELIRKAPESEIASIISFYDYLEVQPPGNNIHLIENSHAEDINSMEDLEDAVRTIVKLGEKYNKPVVATSDAHFINPEDGLYRQIILDSKDADKGPVPLYIRTTEEMLDEFAFLGSNKAEEIVIDNSNLIADMCEKITPVRPDKCPPVIENSEEDLRRICYTKAHEMYGEELPKIVEERLERELNSIIGNGYAVMYIIAQKLVWKSVEDGYLVGSRGSVGSSFAATMSGITEVNPLSPHYYCKKCHYTDFDSEEVKKFAGMAGCDMPDKDCPVCGEKLCKDGFDIPFETFLGFKGDKEPDIDLNFSGEYQSKAHKYTEVIFGYGQTFKAGTIGTLADKTAYGMVKHYFEDRGKSKRPGEINRLVQGCVGVRRTTGQHPGGIVVLPVGEDINSFTAVQHPANDVTTDIVTTHFDYHSIDHNLLKLDILGHDDPTMIRMLQDLTGVDPVTIPLDDKKVMSLFQSTEALGVTPEQLRGIKLGSLGIPEFGTPFAMQMLVDTKPQYFSDLVRIAGLSHGTDVWLGNAETLIKEGTATISTAICTRDDIMVYLIGMGLDPAMAFSIMENVRKGKVAKGKCDKWEGWKEEMKNHNVPDWYIWSCEKIQYMFPKAHAAAYVMMAWRIAYCKIYYPLAYYTAFFSIRSKAFDYEKMCMGKEALEEEMDKLEKILDSKDKTPKDEDTYKDMKIVQEMYARGFEFTKIDLYKAKARDFQIIDGKIMPAFTAIDKLGESCAVMIEDEAKQGQFFSKDDLRQRAKVPQTVMETMDRLGILEGMTQSNQLNIFDFLSE